MRLIIVRHGETEENLRDVIQGHLPGVLSKNGIEQARKVALRLKKERIDFIYSSDLARAVDTAKEIVRHHPEARLTFTPELRERHMGEFEGKTHREIGWDVIEMSGTYPDPKSGESKKQMLERVGHFLSEIAGKHPQGNILLVGHGGSIGALLTHLVGKEFTDDNKKDLKNTGVTVIEVGREGTKLHLFNCTAHL